MLSLSLSQLCIYVERGTACARALRWPAAAPPRRSTAGRCVRACVSNKVSNVGARRIECPVNAVPHGRTTQQVVTRARHDRTRVEHSVALIKIDTSIVRAGPATPDSGRTAGRRPQHRAQDSIRFSFRNSDGCGTRIITWQRFAAAGSAQTCYGAILLLDDILASSRVAHDQTWGWLPWPVLPSALMQRCWPYLGGGLSARPTEGETEGFFATAGRRSVQNFQRAARRECQ